MESNKEKDSPNIFYCHSHKLLEEFGNSFKWYYLDELMIILLDMIGRGPRISQRHMCEMRIGLTSPF